MPIWVRLSKLHMEWIDADLLWRIGGMLDTTYKVDPITESQARGRFTRICVVIDITKPLKGSIDIEDRTIKVEYENLGLICFKCGRIGHSKDLCKEGMGEHSENVDIPSDGGEGNDARCEPFGPWLQVSYGRNERIGNIRNIGGVGVGHKATNRPHGFEVLNEEMEEVSNVVKDQTRAGTQSKTNSSKVLFEISNRGGNLNKQGTNKSKKQMEGSRLSRPTKASKENVDIPGTSDFEAIALKLKEAMEVAME
ncbi:hypothetical protein Ddye_031244 [Dipteronia dyeriana]|uniref:CCHC-type domain-containing protein n=1 Tax=Dipteronia dyeriana TaxID=168575 RepID=A0AAD9WNA5_9ROSI|nr:hypothetical protein Ddye_031244 [Dipteronia dyeriana]